MENKGVQGCGMVGLFMQISHIGMNRLCEDSIDYPIDCPPNHKS